MAERAQLPSRRWWRRRPSPSLVLPFAEQRTAEIHNCAQASLAQPRRNSRRRLNEFTPFFFSKMRKLRVCSVPNVGS